MKSGYHIINAAGLDLNNLGTVSGLNAKCKQAIEIGKPAYLENVVNGDEAIIPIPVALLKASTSVNIYAPTGNLAVSSADVVSALTEVQREKISSAAKKAK